MYMHDLQAKIFNELFKDCKLNVEKRERRPLEREKERNEEERKDILQQQQEHELLRMN